eukprot:gb/GEZN01020691.1/.p1 GENE.gb/GEZN01020691.1/~~gb/GEZN01020691.1/.p1  ORF type:complete len:164 (+),score=9.69 gb/GEZN01020691.1/:23-514(+)
MLSQCSSTARILVKHQSRASPIRAFALYRDVFSIGPVCRYEKEEKPATVDPKLDVDTSASLYIAEQPPIPVEGFRAICYGAAGDVRGHPVQYIQLNRTKMDQPGTCKYCGLRFIHKHGLEKYNKTFETRQPDQGAIPAPFEPLWQDTERPGGWPLKGDQFQLY